MGLHVSAAEYVQLVLCRFHGAVHSEPDKLGMTVDTVLEEYSVGAPEQGVV